MPFLADASRLGANKSNGYSVPTPNPWLGTFNRAMLVSMSQPLHPQNVIALIWDFDKTLIPGYMQDPIFAAYNVDGSAFWRENPPGN